MENYNKIPNLVEYSIVPPTIDQFVSWDRYLNRICRDRLFPFWKKKLEKIFPNQTETRYPVVIIKGGIGTGKTTAARIIAEYNKCRILSLYNPHQSLGISPGESIKFKYFNRSKDLAEECFKGVISEWEDLSSFFTGAKDSERINLIEQISEGINQEELGESDAIFYCFSEIDLKDKSACDRLISEANKWKSRFGSVSKYFGGLVIDATSSDCDNIVEKFLEIFGDQVLVINTNQWEVREELGIYGKKGWFKVYTGDENHSPFIFGGDLYSGEIIEVPEELRPNFEGDLKKSLRDLAGIDI